MDIRAMRTRARLQAALLDLAAERPLDQITIGDIVDRAGVNRSSFYQHYGDKETLLADALEEAVTDVETAIAENQHPAPQENWEIPDELRQYLRRVVEHAEVLREVLGPSGSAIVRARLSDRVDQIIRSSLDELADMLPSGIPLDVVSAGIAGSAMSVIAVWLSRDPRPDVETAAAWVWTMLTAPLTIDPCGKKPAVRAGMA